MELINNFLKTKSTAEIKKLLPNISDNLLISVYNGNSKAEAILFEKIKGKTINYKRKIISNDDYYNDLLTKCPHISRVMVGSAFCIFKCEHLIFHDKNKKKVVCNG